MTMRVPVAGKLVFAAAIAYFGGSIVFGMLAAGMWLTPIAALVLSPDGAAILVEVCLWICRVGVFLVLVFVWFEDRAARFPQVRR